MNLRYSFIAVGLAAAALTACDSGPDRSLASFDSTMEANAAEAEAAEAEVAKLKAGEADKGTAHEQAGHEQAEHELKGKKSEKTAQHAGKKDQSHKAPDHKTAEHKTPAAKTHREPASSAKNNVYIVQIGAFHVKANAERLHGKLKADGFPVMMREMNHSKNGLLYLVRMEPTPNRHEAETMVASIKEKSQLTPTIIVRPDGE